MNRYTQIGGIVRIVLCGAVVLGALGVLSRAVAVEVQTQRLDTYHPDYATCVTEVTQCELTPDKKYVVYFADLITDNDYDLYIAATDGSTPPVRVVAPAKDSIYQFTITPDSKTLVLLTDGNAIYSAPIEHPEVKVLLAQGSGYSRIILNNRNCVFYTREDIFTVPLDGSSSPKSLVPADTQGKIHSPFMTSDGERIIYLAADREENKHVIVSAPVSGEGESVRLYESGIGNKLESLNLTADDAWVTVFERLNSLRLLSIKLRNPFGLDSLCQSKGSTPWEVPQDEDTRRAVRNAT